MNNKNEVEIWGGLECTINRVGNQYLDQSAYSGHYQRGISDIELVGSLGVTMLRYPILWERHQPNKGQEIDWSSTEKILHRMKELNITPIAGLVHQGSGPLHVNFFDGSFENGLAVYGKKVYTSNDSAIRCYEHCGFLKEGISRDVLKYENEYWSLLEMSILEEEWQRIKLSKAA